MTSPPTTDIAATGHDAASNASALLPGVVDARRVLVVDDELDIREALELVMRDAGWEVTTADSGEAALEAARGGRFDVVVTDYRMPGLSGAQTLQALKRLDPETRVIVATGYGSAEQEAECRAVGADDYVRKPFDLGDIVAAVARLMARG